MKSVSTSRNVLFGFLSWFLPLGFTFALTPMIVRGLGAEEYGLYTLIISIVGYMASLNFNVGRGITKFVSGRQAGTEDALIGEILSATLVLYLGIGLVGGAAIVILSGTLVDRVLHIPLAFQPAARLSLCVGAAGLLFTLLSQMFGAVPQALKRFDLYGSITVASGITTIAGNGLMVWLGYGFTSLVAWNVAVSGLTFLAFATMTRRLLPGVRLTLTMRGSMLGELLRFSAAVTVYQVAGNVFVLLERGWIARRLGPAALTYYVVPMTIAVYIHAFITSLTLILFPLASEASAKGDAARLHVIYSRAVKYICVPVVFLVMVLVVGGERLLNEWMGPEFARACEGVLKVHAISFGVLALLIVPWQIADGSGFPGRNAVVCVLWLLIGIPVAALLTPMMGIRGTAFARLAAMATVPAYMMYIERRVFGRLLTEMWRRIGLCMPVAGGAAAMCLAGMLHLFPRGWAIFAGSVAASGLLMTGILWAMGYLDREEKDGLRQLLGLAPGDLAA